MKQNGSSIFKTDNDLIVIFYFFLLKVGINTVSIQYWYSIGTILIQYQYDIVSIATCQIIVIDSITKKCMKKKYTFTVIESLSIYY
jgi:hypothetical protein